MPEITKEALEENMRVKLQTFNNENVEITNDTIHSEVVSESDGFKPNISSAKLYKGSIMWTVWRNGGKNSTWPKNWLSISVSELADFIISKQTA